MINIKDIISSKNLFLIAGPCVIESKESCFEIAEKIKEITSRIGIKFIFKASYQKANRSKLNSFSGPGLEDGLSILKEIRDYFNIPITTDVHSTNDIEKVKEIFSNDEYPKEGII